MSFIAFSFARLVFFALIDLPPKVTGDRRASRGQGRKHARLAAFCLHLSLPCVPYVS